MGANGDSEGCRSGTLVSRGPPNSLAPCRGAWEGLFPDVSFIVIDVVFFEEFPVFFLECGGAMMLTLVTNVFDHGFLVAGAEGK